MYADNDLACGYLTRRRDPVWGAPAVAAQANLNTFSYVNAAPQATSFNQEETLWAGLEDYVLLHARSWRQRLSVSTAPVLAETDPIYRGIAVPRRFWEVAAWTTMTSDGAPALAATGHVLDQSAQLDAVLAAETRTTATLAAEEPTLGAYLTYQMPILDIASLTGHDLGPRTAVDRLGTATPAPAQTLQPAAVQSRATLARLQHLGDLRL